MLCLLYVHLHSVMVLQKASWHRILLNFLAGSAFPVRQRPRTHLLAAEEGLASMATRVHQCLLNTC